MSKFKIEPADRIKRLPPYLFGRLNALKLQKRRAGIDVIDLGMGNPLDGAPRIVIDKLCEAIQDPRNHRYSVSRGVYNLRREVAIKYADNWNVQLNPDDEVLACIGSKEGFSHLCLAMLGPGDTAIVTDPVFPIHNYAVALAGGNVISVPLGNDEQFLNTVAMICEHLYPRPKLLILNYPHNPTAMTVDEGFFEPVVELAKRFNIAVIHDFAYGETCFDGYKAPSFLSVRGAKDVGVEFTTMSKPYSMAGFRIGFAAGNRDMIEALATIKGYYDYGIFQPIQIASIIAMRHCREDIVRQNADRLGSRDAPCFNVRLGKGRRRASRRQEHHRLCNGPHGRRKCGDRAGKGFRRKRRGLYEDSPCRKRESSAPGDPQHIQVRPVQTSQGQNRTSYLTGSRVNGRM